jgi:hypothetical protein
LGLINLGFVISPRWGSKTVADGILKSETWCLSRFYREEETAELELATDEALGRVEPEPK